MLFHGHLVYACGSFAGPSGDCLPLLMHPLIWGGNTQVAPAAAAAVSLQSCLTLCDPIDGGPPGSPVPGILQARTLEWVRLPPALPK